MTEHPKPCHFAGHDQPRMLRSHVRDCEASGCEGCTPCTERHCGICGVRHCTDSAPLHCPGCVGDVRTDLTDTVKLEDRMLIEAIHRGISSEAAMLAGPCANYEAWRNRRASITNRRTCTCPKADGLSLCPALLDGDDWAPCPDATVFAEDNRDEPHPTWIVGSWAMLVGEHYGHDQTLTLTTESAAAYLKANLSDLAQDPLFPFEELAREVRACRGHLEDVLHDGEREERGAPCYMCGAARLVKDYGEDDGDDRWTCPRCGQVWNESEYRENVKQGYVALSEVLNSTDMAGRTRVPEGTVRRWASSTTKWVARGDGTNVKVTVPPKLRPSGRAEGRWLYRVEDVLALRDRRLEAVSA